MDFAPLIPELHVSDLQKSLNFYLVALGFRLLFSREDEGFHFLEKEGAQLMLSAFREGSLCRGSPGRRLGDGLNLAFRVEDLDRALDLMALEGRFFQEPSVHAYQTGDAITTVRQATVEDPDGYLLRFVQRLVVPD
ncbi:MAG: hypothetical protein RL318_2125 [Fibrobacterota bacterium]|jgi:catechol 2,3-dioxygenase-like lactoylglutathione lyase family enzyme